MSEPVRLDRRVAELARCSRSEATQYIENGWVSVDGEVVEEPQFMVAEQAVTVDPAARPEAIEPATMLLHKAEGDLSCVRPLKRHFQHLSVLMPLDTDASGLVVVSQDGRVGRRLTEDYAQIEQEFLVEVRGTTGPYTLGRISRGLSYRGRALPPCKVSWQNEVRLRFAIKDVQPGQLRHMCTEVGLEVIAIRRLRIGRVSLGKMPVGEWRYLPVGERF